MSPLAGNDDSEKNNLNFEYLSEKEIFDMSNIYTSADQLIGNTPLLDFSSC